MGERINTGGHDKKPGKSSKVRGALAAVAVALVPVGAGACGASTDPGGCGKVSIRKANMQKAYDGVIEKSLGLPAAEMREEEAFDRLMEASKAEGAAHDRLIANPNDMAAVASYDKAKKRSLDAIEDSNEASAKRSDLWDEARERVDSELEWIDSQIVDGDKRPFAENPSTCNGPGSGRHDSVRMVPTEGSGGFAPVEGGILSNSNDPVSSSAAIPAGSDFLDIRE